MQRKPNYVKARKALLILMRLYYGNDISYQEYKVRRNRIVRKYNSISC